MVGWTQIPNGLIYQGIQYILHLMASLSVFIHFSTFLSTASTFWHINMARKSLLHLLFTFFLLAVLTAIECLMSDRGPKVPVDCAVQLIVSRVEKHQKRNRKLKLRKTFFIKRGKRESFFYFSWNFCLLCLKLCSSCCR